MTDDFIINSAKKLMNEFEKAVFFERSSESAYTATMKANALFSTQEFQHFLKEIHKDGEFLQKHKPNSPDRVRNENITNLQYVQEKVAHIQGKYRAENGTNDSLRNYFAATKILDIISETQTATTDSSVKIDTNKHKKEIIENLLKSGELFVKTGNKKGAFLCVEAANYLITAHFDFLSELPKEGEQRTTPYTVQLTELLEKIEARNQNDWPTSAEPRTENDASIALFNLKQKENEKTNHVSTAEEKPLQLAIQ